MINDLANMKTSLVEELVTQDFLADLFERFVPLLKNTDDQKGSKTLVDV